MNCKTCEDIVIGSSCEDQINYGETIDIIFTYLNQSETPIDLTGSTASILTSNPSVIKDNAVVTIPNPPDGRVRVVLDRTSSLELKKGRNNRFRLQLIQGPNSDDVTPEIWIQVT